MELKIRDWVRANTAFILMLAGFSGLLLYVFACVVSPVSWSPDSSKFALLVTPSDNVEEAGGIFTYDVVSDERVLIDKVFKGEVLSGPAWSPDGKWIAYYKVVEPNETSVEGGQEVAEKSASEVFSEDNMMLPGFVYEAGKGMMDEYDETKTGDVTLVVVSADGKEEKARKVVQWLEDDVNAILYLQPQWSADSARVFYLRSLDDISYVGSLDIETGASEAHIFTEALFWAVSPDGEFIGAALEDTVIVSRVDGSACTYYAIDFEVEGDSLGRSFGWSGDSTQILFAVKDGFFVVDAATGDSSVYRDETAEEAAYPVFSHDGDSIYYLAQYLREEVGESEGSVELRSMNLESGKVSCVMPLYEVEDGVEQSLGGFSFSPDGKSFVVRLATEVKGGEDDEKRSKLIIWDGSEKRVVETDGWLEEYGVE